MLAFGGNSKPGWLLGDGTLGFGKRPWELDNL
jgi:hypothetical protein